ncbi:MAG: calcium-translocating P-type ATPase, PMCA-type [Candidatus Micrarchaeota archaeon]|nr:calcium-translocating P-type ATPase, PMCA-type [Candidatus Micrarchaeota archaeon]
MEQQKWHSLQIEAVFRELGSGHAGLDEGEARERLGQAGENKLVVMKRDPWYAMLLKQFKSLPILMLIAAAAISFAIGLTVDSKKLIDGTAITVAILLAVFFGFFQEYKAEKAMEALKRMVVQKCVAVRAGKDVLIESTLLVPGDVVVLEEGSRVPADIRILESANLACDQSMLTGESRPSAKEPCALLQATVLSERKNLLFSGTVIVRGHCRGIVVETGMRTEFGKIVGFVGQAEDKETVLQRNLSGLSKNLGYAGIALAALFFAIGVWRGETAMSMFVVAVTLAVAVIPEGLPTVLAITLAIGVQKMARKNAIVRKMASVETLGSATVICTDKTGTITQNRMAVQEIVLAEKAYGIGSGSIPRSTFENDLVFRRAVEVMSLCNNAVILEENGGEALSGDPTETALLAAVFSCCGGERPARSSHGQVAEIPFDSDRKMMSSVRLYGNKRMAFVKGAPEQIFRHCKKIMLRGGEAAFSPKWRRKMADEAQSMGNDGMRTLALACRIVGKKEKYTPQNTERGLVLVGLVAMEDPPRLEVPHAIGLCKSAGIRVVMLTGDSLPTACTIASKVGLFSPGQKAYDSAELEGMSDEELRRAIYSSTVFARVTPEQKYRIVAAFMKCGEVVAVTGDGVNDAPAIRKADIGIAMGISGTDVTKEVSDIVLTDDNFVSIMHAVRYGRTTFNNIKSFVRYQISTNVAALLLMFGTPALGLPIPLFPLQILWINIMVDGPPALALGAEPPKHTEMDIPPRSPKERFLGKNLITSILFLGALMAAIAFTAFSYYQSFAPEKSYTAVFTLFVFLQLANSLNCRSGKHSVFTRFFGNPYLLAAIAVSVALQLAIVYYSPLEEVFKTVPLAAGDLALLAAASSVLIVAEEMKKRFLPDTTSY